MTDAQLTDLSNALFNGALGTYLAAMVALFFGLAFTRVAADGFTAEGPWGRRAGLAGRVLLGLGWAAHLGSLGARVAVTGRVPLGNMYEYGSTIAAVVVGIGLLVVARRYAHLLGFVAAGAVLMMVSALLLFAEPGPLLPALESYWLQIHVSAMMFSSSVFIVAFVATVLYLVRDAAERRVAATDTYGGSTVGAAQLAGVAEVEGAVADDGALDAPDEGEDPASPLALRDSLNPVWFPAVPFVVVFAFVFAVWRNPVAAMAAASAFAVIGASIWYAVPYLPPAASLDNLAYRTTAFAFPLITFGIMCGAIWAEEAWGRYWGWDPKETGSFVTWTLYAGYLHARSTRGWRGPRAAWVGVVAFVGLMITYYAVNLFVVGLHSYAGV